MSPPAASGPEVLAHGPELGDGPGQRVRSAGRLRLPHGSGSVLVIAALVLGGVWYAGRPALDRSHPPARAAPAPVGLAEPDPRSTDLISGLAEGRDLTAPPQPALDSFIASGGHILLFFQVRNDSAVAFRVLDGVVPQDGASRDLTAGGLAAGTSNAGLLIPGDSTEVFVRLTVECATVLDGTPAASVLLLVQQSGRHPRLERVAISDLGAYWDEARHAACRAPDAARDVRAQLAPSSVRAVRNADGTVSVSAVAQVHDAAGFAVVLNGPATAAGGGRFVVDGGSTSALPLRWSAGRCGPRVDSRSPIAPRYSVTLPQLTAVGQVDLGAAFPSLWRAVVVAACR